MDHRRVLIDTLTASITALREDLAKAEARIAEVTRERDGWRDAAAKRCDEDAKIIGTLTAERDAYRDESALYQRAHEAACQGWAAEQAEWNADRDSLKARLESVEGVYEAAVKWTLSEHEGGSSCAAGECEGTCPGAIARDAVFAAANAAIAKTKKEQVPMTPRRLTEEELNGLDYWAASDLALKEREQIHAATTELRALRAEVERLTLCLSNANAATEKFERLWYLTKDEIEQKALTTDEQTAVRTLCFLLSKHSHESYVYDGEECDRAIEAIARLAGVRNG